MKNKFVYFEKEKTNIYSFPPIITKFFLRQLHILVISQCKRPINLFRINFSLGRNGTSSNT